MFELLIRRLPSASTLASINFLVLPRAAFAMVCLMRNFITSVIFVIKENVVLVGGFFLTNATNIEVQGLLFGAAVGPDLLGPVPREVHKAWITMA
jgi:hypothetical protein